MNYKTVAVLSQNGNDDFTLQLLDIPEKLLSKFTRSGNTASGSRSFVLDAVPTMYNPSFLLLQEGRRFEFFAVEQNLLQYQTEERYSVRGNKMEIIPELLDHFMTKVQESGMCM